MHEPWWITIIKALIVINVVMVFFALTTWLERKLLGRMQHRYGPNRAGPKGLLVPIADLLKLIRKEAFAPGGAKQPLYIIAPIISMFTALAAFSVLPFGAGWTVCGYYITGAVVNVPISLILIFALGSLGIYGFIIGGWASESKYSILGSMRTCAQLVSYEVSLALSVLGVVLMGQSLNLADIVDKQQATVWFFIPQFVGLCVFLIGGTAETSRAPFDLPEADTELVAGYHTEYSGMRWGALPGSRVHQHARALRPLRDALLRRLPLPVGALARPVRPDLVRAQAVHPHHHLHLAARVAAAPALRPADALRLEGAAPGRDPERR